MSECVLFTIALSIYVVYASILYFAYFQMVMRDDMAWTQNASKKKNANQPTKENENK